MYMCVRVCVSLYVGGREGEWMSDKFGLKVGYGLGMVGWGRVTSIEERREEREDLA